MTLRRESSLMKLFVETRVWSEDRQKRVQQFIDTALNTLWYVHSTILFRKLLGGAVVLICN